MKRMNMKQNLLNPPNPLTILGSSEESQIHSEKPVAIRPIRGNPRPILSPLGSSLSSSYIMGRNGG